MSGVQWRGRALVTELWLMTLKPTRLTFLQQSVRGRGIYGVSERPYDVRFASESVSVVGDCAFFGGGGEERRNKQGTKNSF